MAFDIMWQASIRSCLLLPRYILDLLRVSSVSAAVTVVDSGAQALDLLGRSAPGTFQLILTVSRASCMAGRREAQHCLHNQQQQEQEQQQLV